MGVFRNYVAFLADAQPEKYGGLLYLMDRLLLTPGVVGPEVALAIKDSGAAVLNRAALPSAVGDVVREHRSIAEAQLSIGAHRDRATTGGVIVPVP